METKFVIYIFICICFISTQTPLTLGVSCPNLASPDCICQVQPSGNLIVTCNNISSVDVLLSNVRSFRQQTLDKFLLINSDIGYLPSNLFFEIRVKQIDIHGTPISHFTEASESAFLGLENSLEELALRYDRLTSETDVTSLSDLSKLGSLDLSFNDINFIGDSWFQAPPKNLQQLYLKNNGIRGIGSKAFSKIFLLQLLDLSENEIVLLERSMLPQEANNLEFIYLSYNRIEQLPENFFSSMPSLKRVYIDHNQLTTLPELVWFPIWQPHLEVLDLLGNYIACECDGMLWLTKFEVSFLKGVCADPDKLRGRKLTSIWPWDICEDAKLNKDRSNLWKKIFLK